MTDQYVRTRERFAAGDRSMMVLPFDMMVLQSLPEHDANVGGMYQLGASVHEITKHFEGLSSTEVSARVRAMEHLGLVHQVRMVGQRGKHVWQRTQLGDKELNAWSKPKP